MNVLLVLVPQQCVNAALFFNRKNVARFLVNVNHLRVIFSLNLHPSKTQPLTLTLE